MAETDLAGADAEAEARPRVAAGLGSDSDVTADVNVSGGDDILVGKGGREREDPARVLGGRSAVAGPAARCDAWCGSGLPAQGLPSDHLALLVDLDWAEDSDDRADSE